MSRLKACALVVLLVLVTGCQSRSVPTPPKSADDPAVLAAQALASSRYADAARLYQRALRDAPGKMELHYGLAVANSYVDRRDDAIREFRWVLQYGPPNAPEVQLARRWLSRAGALPVVSYAAASPDRSEKDRTAGNASLEGRAVFAEDGQSPQPMRREQLFLVGQPNSPTQRERYNLRTDENGTFKFPDVVPGPYKLTNRVAGKPTWRMRVELKVSEVKVLELTPANSTTMQDDFPESPPETK